MLEEVEKYKKEVLSTVVSSAEALEQFRMRFVSRKSVMVDLFNGFKNVPNDQKKSYGESLNALKDLIQERFTFFNEQLKLSKVSNGSQDADLTLPVAPNAVGSRHPISIIWNEIITIFERIGFTVEEGPEIEDDWHNFSALNFAENHPAREMQDTFFIEKNPDILLRTHTSNVQVRLMQAKKPPLRAIMPGRVYRNEAISARAHCFFHQVEGLYVDKNVGFKDLKDTLYHFAKEMFGSKIKVRFRPSYFPFTEPSAEMDISCLICGGSGCRVCKHSGWVEILGSGMVDPNVLQNCGIDPEEYTGFAFGMGIERIAMLKFQINDLRLYSENDVRFLSQFKGLIH